jgi:hypothetical protein
VETALDELKTHQRGPGWCYAAAIPTGSARRSGRTCWSTTPSAPSCTKPPWRPRSTLTLPRVVKRKMSNFALKRDLHRHWPKPTKSPGQAVVIVAQTARAP